MAAKAKAKAKAKAQVKKATVRAKAATRKAAKTVAKKAKVKAAPVPKGYHTASPYLTVKGGTEALAWYQKAFGAKVKGKPMMGPNNLVMHAEFKIGDSLLMLGDEMPPEMGGGNKSPQSLGGTGGGVFLYVKNCDALWNQAVSAGAKIIQPLADQFWGDRYGKLEDPFGHQWSIGTHIEDVTPREMARRMAAMSGPPQA